MTPADRLSALRRRTPDSIAPDGAPLRVIVRGIEHLSANERDVIVERATGWEKASSADLARIFCTTHQAISAVLRAHRAVSKGGVA